MTMKRDLQHGRSCLDGNPRAMGSHRRMDAEAGEVTTSRRGTKKYLGWEEGNATMASTYPSSCQHARPLLSKGWFDPVKGLGRNERSAGWGVGVSLASRDVPAVWQHANDITCEPAKGRRKNWDGSGWAPVGKASLCAKLGRWDETLGVGVRTHIRV